MPTQRPTGAPDARERRRHPAERRVSRYTGLLLLVMLLQAAFGYALVGLTAAAWVRTVHLVNGLVVLGLAWHVPLAARKIPWRTPRERLLLAVGWPLALLASFQWLFGLGLKGWLGFLPWPSVNTHVGLGLLVMLLVVVAHVAAILPSLLLSAQREHERSLQP